MSLQLLKVSHKENSPRRCPIFVAPWLLEIKECCKGALEKFFDGRTTLDETTAALGWMDGPGSPILILLKKKALQCLKKGGKIDSRKLKAVSWEVPEADDQKVDKRPYETTLAHVGENVVAAAGDQKVDQRTDKTNSRAR